MIRCRSSRWNTCSPNGITGGSATRATDGTTSPACEVALTWSPAPLLSVSLTVTITRGRSEFVQPGALFAVGAGMGAGARSWHSGGYGPPELGGCRGHRAASRIVVRAGGVVVGLAVRAVLGGGRLHVDHVAGFVSDLGALGDDVHRLAAQDFGG